MSRIITASAASLILGFCMAAEGTVIPLSENCSLADAIHAANNDAPYGGCPAGAGNDIVTLTRSQVVFLTSELPVVNSWIHIEGNEGAILRNLSGPRFRLFEVGPSGSLLLTHIRLSYGAAVGNGGGAVYVAAGGNLQTEDVVLSFNEADYGGGAIMSYGSVVLIGTSVHGNSTLLGSGAPGGGIHLGNGHLEVYGGEIRDNVSQLAAGGGIMAEDSFILLESTKVAGNLALWGGGVFAKNGTLLIFNSEVSGNSCWDSYAYGSGWGAGVYVEGAYTEMRNPQFLGNRGENRGAGLYIELGQVRIDGGLFAGNYLVAPNVIWNPDGYPSVGGGIFLNAWGALEIFNAVITGNDTRDASGLLSGGQLTIGDTMIVDQARGPDCAYLGGTVTDLGGNSDSDGTCGFQPPPAP